MIPWFRELFDDLSAYRGHALFDDVLAPWIDKAQVALSHCATFRSPTKYDSADEDAQSSMWNMYALSRVNDCLLMPFQPQGELVRPEQRLRLHEYQEFFTNIGFTTFDSEHFSPFRHEIVRVHQSDADDEATGVVETRWPGLMFGDMLFSRSGVEVIGGSKHVVQGVADCSTLYFAFRRLYRKTEDLSRGWGHNSQWRTSIRRDYECDGRWIYNLDGRLLDGSPPPGQDDYDLTLAERIELCRNRCFVISRKADADLWPYDDRFEELVNGGFLTK